MDYCKLDALQFAYDELGKEIEALKKVDYPWKAPKLNNLYIRAVNKEMTWQEAMDYAESIGMRLPTKLELQAIAESTDKFNYLGCVWSSSSISDVPQGAWYVYLSYGYTFNVDKTDNYRVLCVRDI
jgi:hypothetical protein